MDYKKIKKHTVNREIKDSYFEKIAGGSVKRLAGMWKKYCDDLIYLEDVITHEYIINEAETKEQSATFKAGIRAINEFLDGCFEEHNSKEIVNKIIKEVKPKKSTTKNY